MAERKRHGVISRSDPRPVAYRLILSGRLDGPTNMALDEAILLAASQALAPPTIRLYGWSPSALSLGYAQKLRAEIDLERCQAWGVDIVRRPTGGRAVLHDQELTYSLVAPEEAFPAPPSILATYREISRALIAGLAQLGIDSQLVPEPPRTLSRPASSAACFATPSAYEVAVAGKKIVGSAQKRWKGYLLQQGSILISLDRERLFALLHPDAGESSWKGRGSGVPSRPASSPVGPDRSFPPAPFQPLGEQMTSIEEVLGRPVSFEEVTAAICRGFEEAWEIALREEALSEREGELAAELRREKYARSEWNLRR
ncbi:MAG: lipoate--protein ligase family protein [Candidatus Tectomicrobia bacterium]|uniref:Lipoate--protein ligase family protein n=1 Tax=Tectimicrobiota bacterium TaxID=2528274 RepID=A0A932CMG0_UNCTE|nr:lipoate--protein ligase family protein [Candidatus Tectomicrobia bacterium]